jgi:hypothetical protein
MHVGVACLGFEQVVGKQILILHFCIQGPKTPIIFAIFCLPDHTLTLMSSAIHLNYNT